jgi:DNA uptake protein ComE-like DNA-binding protein
LAQDPITIQEANGIYVNESLFRAILVADDPMAAFRGRFTVLAPDLTDDGYLSGYRFGLENESARLNLNTVLLADSIEENGAQNILMTLPGMTEPIAAAILDWIDPDDDARLLGAERQYYSALSPGYEPRNGPLGSLEELLLVRDVTPALLFGADLNRNTQIEENEEPFQEIENVDNSDGSLDRGWSAYLTLDSAERNVKADGSPKIDVNMDDLKELHKQLTQVLSQDQANFIIAYRQGGAYEGTELGEQASGLQLDFTAQGRVKLNTILDLIGVKTRIARPGQTGQQGQQGQPGQQRQPTQPDQVSSGGGKGVGGGNGGGQGQDSRIVVAAQFPNDKASMRTYLPLLMENLAVNASPTIPGRININQAPRQILMGIPGLKLSEVEQIIASRDVALSPERPEQAHETWLLTEGIVELGAMKKLMALVTTGGNVYRAQVVGFFDAEGPATRVEAVIDATKTPAIARRRWELEELGPGYSLDTLGAQSDDAQ